MPVDYGVWCAIAVVGYLLGAFPTAYVLVKRFANKNVLDLGSGNVGTLNVHRATNSKKLTAAALLGDMVKSAAAIALGVFLSRAAGLSEQIGGSVGGIAAVLGHNYSIYLKFKGGKGLACAAVLGFYLAPPIVGVWCLAYLAGVAATRILVVGQIVATAALPIAAYFFFPDALVPSYFITALVLVRHAPRIKSVLNGTEPKMYYKIRDPH